MVMWLISCISEYPISPIFTRFSSNGKLISIYTRLHPFPTRSDFNTYPGEICPWVDPAKVPRSI